MKAGINKLKTLVDILKPEKIVAVGEKSAQVLSDAKIPFSKVRHPANGGATKFREQFSELL